jgi:dual-specificity kinase
VTVARLMISCAVLVLVSVPTQNRRVAIKMVRNVPKYRDAAMIEIKILKDLRKHFDETAPFVVLWDCFDFRNHVCMVFEPLGTSIYDFVSENE